ncbi:class I SAM-dependent methyltransferase [Actinomadura sp. DC4]|uniref:class I SAM-dependent methyltransferase n=1 Tax=Actinomadura sp. DC4 TaxID=3055069 RepID=UPI0025B1FCA8|nr:class I SAM-dependent methyltransferase [Actinomadura sp. DC4]MDN3357246.1 class I SAM-dependent methyltransferase [Actinomadura sp. DC4]
MNRRHPVFARVYARSSPRLELGVAAYRAALLNGLSGRVIEVGAGNGLNFSHYPGEVTEVVAVEPETYLRSIAAVAARRTAVPITIVDGLAERLPTADGSCDAAVACLVLCTVPDQDTALAEIRRVLRPGGELRFFEHVGAAAPGRRRLQRAFDATLWPWFGGGCHCARDTRTAIERAGFVIDRVDRLTTADTRIPFPAAPQILGTAIRPV